jgi:glycoside/pentoside/hexuronide:cation symporter, GPH family
MKENNNMETSNNIQSHLQGKDKFVYILGGLPLTIMAGVFMLLYVDFFRNELNLNQGWFIAGQIIYALVNAFNDPLLGQLSDKTNFKKWGSRRLIYVKWGGILWGLIFFGMWFPWSRTNQIVIFIHYVISICAFDMMLTLVVLCWMALLPEMTENVHERNKIQFISGILSSLGALLVLMAQAIMEISLSTFQIFAGICAIISAILYFIIGSKLKERPELYSQEEVPPLKISIKNTLKSKSFITYTGYKFFNFVNNGMGISFLFAYLLILGEGPWVLFFYFLITTPLSWISQAIFMQLAKTINMKKLVLWGRPISMILNVIAFFVILSPGAESTIWIFVALKTILGGYNMFGYPMMMLSIDEDEVIHGTRREGMFLGTNAFFIKFADSVGPIIASLVLYDWFGYIDEMSIQSPETIIGIKFLYFIVPTIMSLFGLIFIYFYPLHGEYLKKIQSQLATMHNEKSREYQKQLKVN